MAATELVGKRQAYYKGRITAFVILSCTVAATGGILFGYDLGISGSALALALGDRSSYVSRLECEVFAGGVTSMEPFLKKFFPDVYAEMHDKNSHATSNYCKFDSQLLSTFTSSLYVAGLVASLCASWVTQAFGRRTSMLLGGAFFMAGAVLGALAVNVYMLILGRVLLGIGVGFTNQIHSGWGWRISIGLAVLPATVLALGTLFLPETPTSLIQHTDSVHKATATLQKIRGTDDVQAELDHLIAAGGISKAAQHPLRTIMRRKYRPQLVMAILIPFFKHMTGIAAITFYSPLIFRSMGLEESSSLLSAVITGVIDVVFILIAMTVVDRVGRRTLFIVGGVQMLATHVMVGGILATQLGDHGGVGKGYANTVVVLVCVYVAGFGLSWGPLAWLVPTEIFPLEIRSIGQSIVVAVVLLLASVVGQTLLPMLCHLRAAVFFFFGGWTLIMTVFVILFVPETKNLPMEKMDQIWTEHWFWKKVVGEDEEEEEEERKDTVLSDMMI
ncbi:hypothetical protein BHM03_00025952 [Ensete ventricosum]|nr:hypothetical protein BHM03_00025952 [Ensete ventricosum]